MTIMMAIARMIVRTRSILLSCFGNVTLNCMMNRSSGSVFLHR